MSCLHYEYLALAKINASVLREAMIFIVEPQYTFALQSMRTDVEAMLSTLCLRLSIRNLLCTIGCRRDVQA